MAGSESQRLYNTLFPWYAEVCAVTQYARRGAPSGGWGGHAAMFLNGAEIDRTAGHPRIRLAAEGTDLSDPDSGVGISVNRIFTNANWIAVAGRAMFFHGDLPADELLDARRYEAVVDAATRSGRFADIAIEEATLRQKPRNMSTEEFVARNSIGTDFALTFARNGYTARLPLPRAALERVVSYLNALNDHARANGYRWNAYTNNCSHVLHNALAAAGVWDAKAVRGSGILDVAKDVLSVSKAVALGRLTDLSFPANTFVRVYEAGNERPIDDIATAFLDHDIRRTLADGWVTTGPGALIATYPMHDSGRNELFSRGRDPFLFSLPLLWDKERVFQTLIRRPPESVTDVAANLEGFRRRVRAALARRVSADPDAPSSAGGAFGQFRELFRAWAEEQLPRIEAQLAIARGAASPS